jgi:hypothetical protein
MSTISPLAVVQATGVAAVDLFLRTYADFVALFDSEELAKALQDELAFVGVSEKTKKSMTIENFFQDIERLCYDLLERGALTKIQRFGITPEAQAQMTRLENSARGIPRGATGGKRNSSQSTDAQQEPVSKWATLTNEQFNRMSSSEVKRLRQTDPDFREAVERLAQEDAAAGPALDSTGKVYLKRADGHFFQEWKYGQSVWSPSFDLRAYMDYSEAHRIITVLRERGIEAQAFEMGNNSLTDVAPKAFKPLETSVTTTPKKWRFVDSGLFTQGNNQRKVPNGQFVLKAGENLYVGSIVDSEAVVKTVSQIGNGKRFTHLQSAIAAAESFDLIVCICDHNGNQVSSEKIKYAAGV